VSVGGGMIKVVILGQGMGASHFSVGVERIKVGEVEAYGVPLANYNLKYPISELEIVASYDVDENKIGKTIYRVAKELIGDYIPIPKTLEKIEVRRGIHLNSLSGMPVKACGLEESSSLSKAIDEILEEWKELKPDVILNTITTEYARPFRDVSELEEAIAEEKTSLLTATQVYAYIAYLYSREVKPIAFINAIPVPVANDPAFLNLCEKSGLVIFGDDCATGATPFTADLIEHMRERNRRVKHVLQLNIGGNTDFLALTDENRNKAKETTKSSVVEDILGYHVPTYIKPTGYLPPLGDKKFVSLHLEYVSFNGVVDEIVVNMRVNDSPALAGLLVDLARLGKIAVDSKVCGTVYEVNAFYMKKPGPPGSKAISKIVAFQRLLEWLKSIEGVKL